MKKLLLTLMFLSPFSFAEWGDTYFCETTHFAIISRVGSVESFKSQKFKFQVSRDKQALIFGKGGYFDGTTAKLHADIRERDVLGDGLMAGDDWDTYFMDKDKFSYTRVGPNDVFAITADCDKF